MGCIGQVGPDAFNARRVAPAAGLPDGVPAYTVNRLCGSGLQAIWSAAMQMRWGGLDLALAGGRRVDEPNAVLRLRCPYRLAAGGPDAGRRHRHDADRPVRRHPHGRDSGERRCEVRRRRARNRTSSRWSRSAEREPVARRRRSRKRSSRSRLAGGARAPSPATSIPGRARRSRRLTGLRPAFQEDGTVTAGNASGHQRRCSGGGAGRRVCRPDDGAAPGWSLSRPWPPLRWSRGSWAMRPCSRCESSSSRPGPRRPTSTRSSSTRRSRRRRSPSSATPSSTLRRVNPYGGAIALGHPVGATGAILSLRVAKDLVRRDLELGVVTMCIGGGQALAALFKRVG